MTRIEQIKQRLAAATPGPWTIYERKRDFMWSGGKVEQYDSADIMAPQCPVASMGDIEFPLHRPTAEFITHSPADIALLLKVVEAARGVKGDWEGDPPESYFSVNQEAFETLQAALAPLLADGESNASGR